MPITSRNYRGELCVLFHNGKAAERGIDLNENEVLAGGKAPHKPGANGYVYVTDRDGPYTSQYYTRVFHCEWRVWPAGLVGEINRLVPLLGENPALEARVAALVADFVEMGFPHHTDRHGQITLLDSAQ